MMVYPIHGWVFWLPLILFLVFVLRGRPRRGPRGWGAHGRGWGPGWDERRQSPVPPPSLDEGVRARLELVEQLESRVTELENRLDFTERLLMNRPGLETAAAQGGA
jgi:hypothetical protein